MDAVLHDKGGKISRWKISRRVVLIINRGRLSRGRTRTCQVLIVKMPFLGSHTPRDRSFDPARSAP